MQKIYITDGASGHPANTFVFVPTDEAKKLIDAGQAQSTETGIAEEETKKRSEKEAKKKAAEKPKEHAPVSHENKTLSR